MSPDKIRYFKSLCARVTSDEAERVDFRPVMHGDWKPESTVCHNNADHWERVTPGAKAIRGWLICGTDLAGGYSFGAHSVVEENGALYDITPHDCPSPGPEPSRLFLRHEGDKAVFDVMLPAYNFVPFNPNAF
jgi:hypothetical protein